MGAPLWLGHFWPVFLSLRWRWELEERASAANPTVSVTNRRNAPEVTEVTENLTSFSRTAGLDLWPSFA